MPATNYGWCLQDSPSMLQAWGSKRKCPDTEEPDSKRQCIHFACDNRYNEMKQVAESDMQCDGDRDRSIPVTSESHLQMCQSENRVPELHPFHSHHQTQSMLNPLQPKSQNMPLHNNEFPHGANMSSLSEENNNSDSSQMCCQTSMIMDLHDECYSTALLPENIMTDAEYEAACNMVAAMESEGGPDPNQYRFSHANSSLVNRESPNIGSNASQTPGWSSSAHSQDIMPYVSDIY